MKCIEENTERLDLLQKTLLLEEKQKKRLLDLSLEKKNEIVAGNLQKLYEGNNSTNISNTTNILDREEAQAKELVNYMVQNSTPSIAPVVKVLTNVQGIFFK